MKEGYLKVGVTRSGKDILISFTDDLNEQVKDALQNLNDGEIFDFYAVFELCRLKEYRIGYREHKRFIFLSDFVERLEEYLRSNGKLSQMQRSLHIVTSIDLISYARRLSFPGYL